MTQVDGEDGLLPLLQEENDHEGEGVGGDTAFSLAVNVAQLQREEKQKSTVQPSNQSNVFVFQQKALLPLPSGGRPAPEEPAWAPV